MLSRGSKIVSTTPQNVTGMLSKHFSANQLLWRKRENGVQGSLILKQRFFPSKQEIHCKKTHIFQLMECLACLPNFSFRTVYKTLQDCSI